MSQNIVFDNQTTTAKSLAFMLYLGHGASFLFSLGLFSFIPLIINYVKRDDTAGTFVHSHHSWQIRSFWWFFLWMLIGGAVALTIIGIPVAMLIWAGAWLWKAYRLIKGTIDLNNNRPMPE